MSSLGGPTFKKNDFEVMTSNFETNLFCFVKITSNDTIAGNGRKLEAEKFIMRLYLFKKPVSQVRRLR